jgi:hypothetical protein
MYLLEVVDEEFLSGFHPSIIDDFPSYICFAKTFLNKNEKKMFSIPVWPM